MSKDKIIWAASRLAIESSQKKNKRNGSTGVRHWQLFEKLLAIFVSVLKIVHLYDRGINNALNIKVKQFPLAYGNLPPAFNNFKILHLTDLHLDGNPKIASVIAQLIKTLEYDICVITGDFRMKNHGSVKNIFHPLKKLVEHIKAPHGIYATLGNHDSYLLADGFEKMGINLLTNESFEIKKDESSLVFTGVDDVHYYFTDNAIYCLEHAPKGFKIALVHSPEMYDVAAENNYSLYLCGHTHGGQICLPNGTPIFTHLYNGNKFIRGFWQHKQLLGYTSEGCGTSGIPIRFNSESEITLFTLKQKIQA